MNVYTVTGFNYMSELVVTAVIEGEPVTYPGNTTDLVAHAEGEWVMVVNAASVEEAIELAMDDSWDEEDDQEYKNSEEGK